MVESDRCGLLQARLGDSSLAAPRNRDVPLRKAAYLSSSPLHTQVFETREKL
jgi:hypothetical protein